MKLGVAIAIAVGLSACTPFAVKYDEKLLKECKLPPKLEGMDGAAIVLWAKTAGPEIVECAQNHNALVKVLRIQQQVGR